MSLEILLSVFYLLLFLWLVSRLPFFRLDVIPKIWLPSILVLKVICGIGFWYVYTFYYKVRSEADIYKYFDDSKIMFDALSAHPGNFFRMFFGLDHYARLSDLYYSRMQVWSPRFENACNFENHSMVRLLAAFRLFSFGYYQVHNVFINMLSFSGLLAIYKTFVVYVRGKEKFLFAGVFLWPIVLFWGSAVIKESFILFASGFTIYYLHQLMCCKNSGVNKHAFRYLVLSMLFLFLLAMFKIALALLITLGYMAWYLSCRIRIWPAVINFMIIFLSSFFALIALARYTPYDCFKILVNKQTDFVNVSNGGVFLEGNNKIVFVAYDKRRQVLEQITDSVYKLHKGSSYFYFNLQYTDTTYVKDNKDTLAYHMYSMGAPAKQSISIPQLSSSPMSFIKNSPMAFLNALSRPFITDSKNVLLFLMALQNTLVLLLLIVSLIFADKRVLNEPAFWFCVFVVVGYYVLFGWVTPVLGALMRYKTNVFPLLITAVILLFNRHSDSAIIHPKRR
jgi:hypothetical protein